MARFSWIARLDHDQLSAGLSQPLQQLGLELDDQVSSSSQLLARDQVDCRIPLAARVTVLASWNCSRSREYQVEVRSSEPQLRRGTRCEQIATELQRAQGLLV